MDHRRHHRAVARIARSWRGRHHLFIGWNQRTDQYGDRAAPSGLSCCLCGPRTARSRHQDRCRRVDYRGPSCRTDPARRPGGSDRACARAALQSALACSCCEGVGNRELSRRSSLRSFVVAQAPGRSAPVKAELSTRRHRPLRRRAMLLRMIFAALLLGFSQQAALAQYPTKPVRIVVPYPPGGAVDAFARVLSQRLSDDWSQQVLIENRPGASTMIGAEQVAKSPADGYTLLLSAELTFVTVPHLYEKIPYDPL